MGEWNLEESINLIRAIEKANKVQILDPLLKIKFEIKDEPKKAMKVSEDKIKIYSKQVRLQDIASKVIFDLENVRKSVAKCTISWSAISDHFKTRSADDIR